ncbi:MAG TPA: SAF domain-containing protein [Myxococcales bacterium]|jgi:flagella basal body P-ring formation protein FlgA
MGMLAKSIIYGAIAGSTWVAARALPVILDWRGELSERVEVVAFARDVAVGQKVGPDDLRLVKVASDLADGSALRQVAVCVGRSARCAAPAGSVVVQGCLARGE